MLSRYLGFVQALCSSQIFQRVVRILQKSGTKIITVPYATQFSQLTENIRIIGTAIKQNKKAKQLIKKINQQIDRTATHTDKFALHVTSNNYIYGKNSLISDAIRHAGFSAFDASGFGESHGFVSTESIIASKPDYLITDKIHTVNNFVSSKDRYHPALGTAYPTQNRIYVDPKLWSCAHQSTPQIIDIIKQGAHEK
jgi:ABC-type Fe3+-hydroxamate transport system substrate-binding protein